MASTTKHIFLQGKCKWAKFFVPSQYGKWSVDLYLDAANVAKFQELKVMNRLKKDDDGYYVSLHRATEITRNGVKRGLQPPTVVNADGTPFGGTAVGNGSDITVDLEYYGFTRNGNKAYACRIDRVRIDNLVPFERSKDLTEEEYEADQAMMEAAPPQPTVFF